MMFTSTHCLKKLIPSIHPFILLKEVEKIPKSPEDDCVKFLSSVTYGKNIFVSTFYYT